MAEHHRYTEDPDPRGLAGSRSYESDVYRRSDEPYRLPDQRANDGARRPFTEGGDLPPATPSYPAPGAEAYSTAAPYRPVDPLAPTAGLSRAALHDVADEPAPPRSALDAIRVPLRPTEYPAVRPGSSAPFTGPEPATAGPGGSGPSSAGDPASASTSGGAPSEGGAYNEPTSFVPSVGKRAAPEAAGADRFIPERAGAARRAADTVYRTRRPIPAVLFAAVVALLMVPAVRLLVQAALVDAPAARGIVPAVLLTLGLPLTGLGLFGISGSAKGVDRSTLLRPPVGYLPVGLILLLAAALATG